MPSFAGPKVNSGAGSQRLDLPAAARTIHVLCMRPTHYGYLHYELDRQKAPTMYDEVILARSGDEERTPTTVTHRGEQ